MISTKILFVFLIIFNCKCKSQDIFTSSKYEIGTFTISYSTPSKNEECIYIDTSSKYYYIVFEQNFDDSIVIYNGQEKIYEGNIITNNRLGVSNVNVKILKSNAQNIVIFLIRRKHMVNFLYKTKYSVCYINYSNNKWDFNYSNCVRLYY